MNCPHCFGTLRAMVQLSKESGERVDIIICTKCNCYWESQGIGDACPAEFDDTGLLVRAYSQTE